MTFWSHLDLACTCLINVNVKKTATIDTNAKMPLWNDFVRSLSKKQNNSGKSEFFLQSKANNGRYSQNREKGDFISVRSEIILQVAK